MIWQGKPSHHCAKGFTLIELLLTLALLATLATVAYPLTALMGKRDRELDLQRSLREIRRAIDAYKDASDDGRIEKSISDSGYPPSLHVLVEGVTDIQLTFGEDQNRDRAADRYVSAASNPNCSRSTTMFTPPGSAPTNPREADSA